MYPVSASNVKLAIKLTGSPTLFRNQSNPTNACLVNDESLTIEFSETRLQIAIIFLKPYFLRSLFAYAEFLLRPSNMKWDIDRKSCCILKSKLDLEGEGVV